MKRKGYIYDKMSNWDLLKEAQSVSCKNKGQNYGVQMHKIDWIKNLCEIQDNILSHRMRTAEYKFEMKVSGQGKLRKISKIDFHPSHIQHQVLVMASQDIIDNSLIYHTYASRKGFGQHKGAMTLNKWVQRYCKENGEYPIYLQLDICKYYDNIRHSIIRHELERLIKDKEYIDAYLEPIEKFSPNGIGIPLGIRPSQIFGNLALTSFDRYVKETLKCKCYIRYLDDMILLCRNRGEAHRYASMISKYLYKIGLSLHQPRIDKVNNGIDFLGYVTYPYRGMFWRTSDKKQWLKRRSKVTNQKRLREIDASAWGYIVHGNKHCKKLYNKMGGISFERLGIERPKQTDRNGRRIIEGQLLSMQMVLNKPITILDLESGVETLHGKDRVVMLVSVMGTEGKLIVNAPMKQFFIDLWKRGVTKVSTIFIQVNGKHYDFDQGKTMILEINNREVGETNGQLVYLDNKEIINI